MPDKTPKDHSLAEATNPVLYAVIAAAIAVAAIGALAFYLPFLRELRDDANADAVDGLISAASLIGFAALIGAEALVYIFYRTAAALRRHERSLQERHERLLRASPAAVLVEQDERIVYANEAAVRMFGAAVVADLTGRETASLVHPDRRVAFSVRTSSIKGGMEAGGAREKMLRLDGTEIDVDVTATAVDLDGEVAVMFAVEDVTARLAAQAEARRGQERFALLTKATNDVIYDRNLAKDTAWWNENYVAAFGRDPQGVPADMRSWEELIHPEDRRRTVDGMYVAIGGSGTFWADEYRYRKADGTYADIYDRGYIIRDDTGRAVRMVGAMMDLTERRKMNASLTEMRTLLEKAQEVAHVGGWYSDPSFDGALTWSEEVFEIFGVTPERFDGKVSSFLAMVHPEDREAVRAANIASWEKDARYDLDHRIVRPDGTVRWVHERAETLRDSSGKALRMIGVAQDITDRKRGERQVAIPLAVATILSDASGMEEAHPRILAAIGGGLEWRTGAVWLPDEGTGTMRSASFWRSPGAAADAFEKATRAAEFRPGQGMIGTAWKEASPHWVTDVGKEKGFTRAESAATDGLRGGAVLPIVVNGKVAAIYEFFTTDAETHDQGIMAMFRSIATHISQFAERRRAEAKAAAGERYVRAIIDNSIDIITVLGADGTVREESRAAERQLGYGIKELVGKNPFDLVHPEDLPRVRPRFEELLRKGRGAVSRQLEYRFRKKDGTWSWLETVGVNLVDDPAVNGILISSRDITDRKRAEQALAGSERRFRAMIDQAPMMISIFSPDGTCTGVNPAWERYWEAKASDAVGAYNVLTDKQMTDLGAMPYIRRAFLGEQVAVPPLRYDPAKIGKPGRPHWISLDLYPVMIDGTVREVIMMMLDVTDRRALEEQERRAETEKNALSGRVLLLLEATSQGIVGVDGLGRCTFVNRSAAQMLGYDAEELIGMEMHGLVHHKAVSGEVQGRATCKIKAAYAEGTPITADDEVFWKKDGTAFPVEYEAHPVRDGARVIGAVVTFTDIGTRLETDRRLRSLDSLRSKIIQIVSQQFRVPLDTVRWNLRMLLDEKLGPLAPAQREFMRLTADANDATIARVRDLLTALDIEEGRITLVRETASIESLWGGVFTDMRRACQVKGLTCEYASPKEPIPGLRLDPEKIRNVLTKLADNAVTYTPAGGRIRAALTAADGKVRFTIADTGIGIPEAEQYRVFERFYRCSNAASMRADASGLGLTIAKHFVERHDGTIGFDPNEGPGTTFWFELPMEENEA